VSVPQIVMEGDTARVRPGDSLSSHLAADSITPEGLRFSQQHVLLDVQKHGRAAAWQIQERAGKWSDSRLRTALKELEELGQVVRFKQTGRTPRGRVCDEFALTILGLEALEMAS
jgi:hypothetical protein